jgi:hypothetical protein
MTGPDSDHWLVRPATIRRLWIVFILVLVALVALDLVIAHHPHFGIDGTFGFGAWFGFLSCVALIVLAKALGAILKRPDTYYDG